jgi:hypothetical protein
MGVDSIDAQGAERLNKIIQSHKRDIKRFKEGFRTTVERHIESGEITFDESVKLIIELEKIRTD